MVRMQNLWKIGESRGALVYFGKACSVQVPVQVLDNMLPSSRVAHTAKPRIEKPVFFVISVYITFKKFATAAKARDGKEPRGFR
jgi:hypothetical protein